MLVLRQIFAHSIAVAAIFLIAADTVTAFDDIDVDFASRASADSTIATDYWDALLLHRITPRIDRAAIAPAPPSHWLALDEQMIAPDFAQMLFAPTNIPAIIGLGSSQVALSLTPASRRLPNDGLTFQQSLLMPGLTSQISESSELTISAVLASQSYGSSVLNLVEAENATIAENSAFMQSYARPEVTHGAGLRVGIFNDLTDYLSFEAAAQSRIDMAEFATIRGLYGSVAELDIPSRVQVGVQFHATPRSSLGFSIEQIFYSEVGAFPSRSLPARFTALLGDSNSPRFAWNDLVIYSLGWQWHNGNDFAFYIDFRTRTQPLPTSSVLADALEPDLADHALLVGITKGLGFGSSLRLSASYAPPEFAFGGNALGIVSDRLDQDFEVQALVQVDF